MTKTEELELLFDRWEKTIPEYQGRFHRDGIIDEARYDRASKKILFIMKEANDQKEQTWNYRDLWEKGVRHRFSFRLADWAYGILNDFPPYEQVRSQLKNLDDAIRSVALVNVKKSGGAGSSNKEEILSHCERNLCLLTDEIEIIQPQIILIGTWSVEIREMLFPEVRWIEQSDSILIGSRDKTKIVDFFHASSRRKSAWLYNRLRDVIQSEEYKSLP